METGLVSKLDRISNLPKDVIDSILVHLPIRDAVRTSILSTKWRYNWISIPHLIFDRECSPLFKDEKYIQSYLVKLVDRVLLLHSGPIHKFKLSNYLRSCPDIDQWILFLSRNGIKELLLEFWPGERYKLPNCLFSCQELNHLELRQCILKPLRFNGLASLSSLHLQDVSCADEVLESLIASCPLLEKLTLFELDGPRCLRIRAPNLRQLYVAGILEDVCFENIPLLTTLRLYMPRSNKDRKHTEQGESCHLVNVLACLNSIERVDVVGYFLEFLAAGSVPERLPSTYHHLKVLNLDANFEDLNEILAVHCLLRSCDNLQTLKIRAFSSKEEATLPVGNFWEVQNPSDCLLNQLQIVKMTGILGLKSELEVIRFILACAPALVTVGININSKMASQEARIFKELMRFRRASAQAEIIYLD